MTCCNLKERLFQTISVVGKSKYYKLPDSNDK